MMLTMLTVLYPYAQIRLLFIVFKKRRTKLRVRENTISIVSIIRVRRLSSTLRAGCRAPPCEKKLKKLANVKLCLTRVKHSFTFGSDVKPGSTRKEPFDGHVTISDTRVKIIGFAPTCHQGYDENMLNEPSSNPLQCRRQPSVAVNPVSPGADEAYRNRTTTGLEAGEAAKWRREWDSNPRTA